jgi:hypothetical protein
MHAAQINRNTMTPDHTSTAQENPANREFLYARRWGMMIACAVFFGICGLVLGAEADSNDRGLIINGIIELSAAGATTFYRVLSWSSFGFVVLAAIMFIVRVLNPQKLLLTQDGLYAPKWAWSRTPTFIPYRNIRAVSSYAVSGQEILKIVHADGKQNVTASLFESKHAFEEFCQELSRRLQTARGIAER